MEVLITAWGQVGSACNKQQTPGKAACTGEKVKQQTPGKAACTGKKVKQHAACMFAAGMPKVLMPFLLLLP